MHFLDYTLPEISKGYLDVLALLSVKLADKNNLLEKTQAKVPDFVNQVAMLTENLTGQTKLLENSLTQNHVLLNRITALEGNIQAVEKNLEILEKNYDKLLWAAICPELVVIPAGSFTMGSNDFEDAKPPHTVKVSSFAMGKTPVTQKQWQAVMGSNPSHFKEDGDDCPVENVSWLEVEQFIQKLNSKTGNTYRLPSEAEWEYAARAGTAGKWCFGNEEKQLGQYAWYRDNSGSRPHPVAQKQANDFGLFDVHGNVWEWVQDIKHNDYNAAPTDGSAWTSRGNYKKRVLRGGSWLDTPASLRLAFRGSDTTDNRFGNIGLRLAHTLLAL
jgi:formylglycine-generating enzyme required for sulfatase activity